MQSMLAQSMKKMIFGLLLALSLTPMMLFAFLGFHSRPVGDDYCHINYVGRLTPWENILHGRSGNLNGSYSNLVINSLLAPLGFQVAMVFPALLLSLWFASTAAFVYKSLDMLGIARDKPIITLSLSGLLVWVVCASVFDIEVLYWYTASLKYMMPIVVMTVFALLLLYVWTQPQGNTTTWRQVAAGGALCFFAAGFAETFAIPMLLALTLLFGVFWLEGAQLARRCLPVLGAGWIATVSAIAIMITAPALTARAKVFTLSSTASSRSAEEFLQVVGRAWVDRLTDPALLAGFALLLAVGLFTGLTIPSHLCARVNSIQSLARTPLLFGLVIQLLLLPMLWAHHSDYPSILGRFSMGYFVVIAINAALLIGVALLLWQRRRIESILIRHAHIVPCAALAIILLLFALTQIRSIHWRAELYLWASVHSLLIALTWQPPPPRANRARRFAIGMGCLYATAWLGAMAVAIAVNYTSKYDFVRTYTFLTHLIVWQGLIWGFYLGSSMNDADTKVGTLLKSGALLVALLLGAASITKNLALVPNFQQYASEFDARHAYILEQRQTGQRHFTFEPYTFDLERYMWGLMHPSPCPLLYYDIESININAAS
ncbi:MAG: hypothetical protein OXF90_14275 [Chloroflexi bacterium]|nr:hypothetical protein [Chloroflexota bacterium]